MEHIVVGLYQAIGVTIFAILIMFGFMIYNMFDIWRSDRRREKRKKK